MSARQTHSEIRLGMLADERDIQETMHETLLAEVAKREDKQLSDSEKSQVTQYRERMAEIDAEVAELLSAIERNKVAVETSRKVRRVMAGTDGGVEVTADEGLVYRDFYTYARDHVLTRGLSGTRALAKQWTHGENEILAMEERQRMLERTPANTLSSNVAGLSPAQHIAQIFQVIDTSRPLVQSANRTTLERGQITYPVVAQRPVVAVQSAEKTEAGNQGMIINMATATASTYLGGGDISWQAINWSTPDALRMWFDLAAADYALKTEQDAAQVLQHSAFTYNISSTLGATPTFAQLMTAIAAGGGDVYANSARIADTVYMAPDRYWYALGLTSGDALAFGNSALLNVNGEQRNLNVVVSRGMDAGVIVVGDSEGLLVAETAGAPVELRVTEPAIGGVEVGLIGAFEAVVTDPGAFAMITTAS